MARVPSKKRGPDGKFRVRVGNRNFKSDISWADANRQAQAYKREIERGLHVDAQSVTVRQYALKWLPLYKSGVKDRTYNDYARLLNTLIDVIGDYAISSIMPDDARSVYVQKFPAKKSVGGEGYSGSAIKKAKNLYVAFFDSAVENGYTLRNPFRSKKAQPDMGKDGTHREITDEERQLIHAVRHSFRPAVMVMLYAGLRRGEALALHADDIVDGKIVVSRAVSYVSNQPTIDTPKTDAGIRCIPVFLPLAAELRGLSGLIAPAKGTGDVMSETAFTRAWESYVLAVECYINGVSQKRWYGLTKADQQQQPEKYAAIMRLKAEGKDAEAEALRLDGWKTFDVRPHDLRHSFCVMCRDAGVDIKQTIEWMGHADEKMILKIYDHVTTRRTAESIEKIQKWMGFGKDSAQNSAQVTVQHLQTVDK